MPIVSLRDFIELGRFGAISLGAERKVLEKILGEPEDVDADSFRKERRPAIMKYGDVEFHFEPSAGLHRSFGPARARVLVSTWLRSARSTTTTLPTCRCSGRGARSSRRS
jgi:hypothetical protein